MKAKLPYLILRDVTTLEELDLIGPKIIIGQLAPLDN